MTHKRGRGTLVVLEGIDFAGKTTQAQRLCEYLHAQGVEALSFHFPHVATELGVLIKHKLKGELAVPDDVLFMLFAANRMECRADIERGLSSGKVIVCDRYSPSEYAYGTAKDLPLDWLMSLEARMPPATVNIFFDITVEVALLRSRERRTLDQFEQSPFLERVREQYLSITRQLSKAGEAWAFLDATESIEGVASNVLAHVLPLLP